MTFSCFLQYGRSLNIRIQRFAQCIQLVIPEFLIFCKTFLVACFCKQIAMFEGKLNNEQFVSRAPEKVVADQREKLEKNRALLHQLEESEARLKK